MNKKRGQEEGPPLLRKRTQEENVLHSLLAYSQGTNPAISLVEGDTAASRAFPHMPDEEERKQGSNAFYFFIALYYLYSPISAFCDKLFLGQKSYA
ncbi:hypothetical protein [Pantoea sp. R102]|uniref:hypothetical protein n=1 Tax=Pantoea sp. R102 TaxID=2507583 RepID=UPI0010A79182|nr:hypothetical protein [Pantoea sp. R102]THD39894.1 hypothetical protein ERD80_06685 [Pantoea sp. R102]